MQTDPGRRGPKALGPLGVCLPGSLTGTPSVDLQREAVSRLESAGYRAVWTNEVIGKDALVQLAVLLSATERHDVRHLHRQYLGPAGPDHAFRGCPTGPSVSRPVRARSRGWLPGAGGQYRPGIRHPAGHDA